MIFCHECGAKIIIDAKFCPECGKKILNQNENFKMNMKIEKLLVNRNKPQKRSKHSIISLLDRIKGISIILLLVIIVSIFVYIFTGIQLYKSCESTLDIFIVSFLLLCGIIYVSSTISDKIKESIRQRIMKTGIPAQARVIAVNNREYNTIHGIRTAELILEVNPETNTPYQAKSTVKVGADDVLLVFRPGSIVQVFIDPEDTHQVEVKY